MTRDTGLLVPLDADSIADAVVRLASDRALRARLGKGARGHFLATFEARGWAVRLRGVYDEVLARVPAEPVSRPVGLGPGNAAAHLLRRPVEHRDRRSGTRGCYPSSRAW